MDTRSGDLYESKAKAIEAGVPERDIAEVSGGKRAIGRLRMACRNEGARRKARRKQQKASRRRNLGVLLFAMLAPFASAWEPEPGASVEASAGMGVSVSDSSAVVPVARVVVDAPVFLGRNSEARIRAALQLHGSPDQTVDLLDVRTFAGAELSVELERRIGAGDGSATYVLIEGGGAARRDARGEGPRERFPGWWSARIGFEHRDEGKAPSRRLTIGLGSSQVVHPRPNVVPRDLMVTGHVDVPIRGRAVARISGDVQRVLWGAKPGDRSVFRLAVTVGI